MGEAILDIGPQGTLFPDLCPIATAADAAAEAGIEARGAVFTRSEVVDFILDLAGYSSATPLHHRRLLEPSFGRGHFLLPAVRRLLQSWRADDRRGEVVAGLRDAVRAVELHQQSFQSTREALARMLVGEGLGAGQVDSLLDAWLINADFLLAPLAGSFDFVVGNPPYVRQELIAPALLAEYRRRYRTLYDRADLYIPFIERSLLSLRDGGKLGFICADRWMKNRYGGPLRELVAKGFHLRVYVDMVDTPAFHTDVIAYPAITIIGRERGGATRTAHRPEITADTLAELAGRLSAETLDRAADDVREVMTVAKGSEPWILESSDQLQLVRRLEASFPTLEEAGCKVGIGVATGADDAFIGPFDALDVEDDRKLPLVMTRDILGGTVEWRGHGVVNPFADGGGLVDLAEYPRLRGYLEARRDAIAKRHVAQKSPANWYRTIDRIYPSLAARPKLLIPDIKGEAHVVYEDGRLYPHHNLYFITSDTWDLRALQAVLLSGIARLFVAVYSTKMRGGFLRFQAQYLRRIRLPRWADVPLGLQRRLVAAAERGDLAECNLAAFAIYGLSKIEESALGGNGDDDGD
jgi:hypothetical protein